MLEEERKGAVQVWTLGARLTWLQEEIPCGGGAASRAREGAAARGQEGVKEHLGDVLGRRALQGLEIDSRRDVVVAEVLELQVGALQRSVSTA